MKREFELRYIDAWMYDDDWVWNDTYAMKNVLLTDEEAPEFLLRQADNPDEWYVEECELGYCLRSKVDDKPVLTLLDLE